MSKLGSKENTLRLQGLSAAEVLESRTKFGSNVLTPPERDPWWRLFLEKFEDPVIRILLIAAVIAIVAGAAHGDYVEGIGIIIAILLATVLAFANEYKANKEFDILNKVSDEVPFKVIRDGNYSTVPMHELVVGDIVVLEVGEEIPADGTVVEAVSFQVDESRLTGEAAPVNKVTSDKTDRLADEKAAFPADLTLRSTHVRDGHGIIKVTAVGDQTEIGKTARAAAEETGEETPLNIQLARLSKVIGVVGFSFAAVTFIALVARGIVTSEIALTTPQWTFFMILTLAALVALVRVWLPIGYDALELAGSEAEPPEWLENSDLKGWIVTAVLGLALFGVGIGVAIAAGFISSTPAEWFPSEVGRRFLNYFMIAITIIVVAVPEGLAMSVTLSLAYSMRKMTAANNLVRRMHACETIGAATVICSDKTGTLTLNEMQINDIHFPSLPDEALNGAPTTEHELLVVEAIAANTTAQLDRTPGAEVRPLGNPTEGAFLLWLEGKRIDYASYRADFPVTTQWTFTTERKFMGTQGTSYATHNTILHVKGAPEIVMERCTNIRTPTGIEVFTVEQKATTASELKAFQVRGMRTLGFAYLEGPAAVADSKLEDIAHGMIWLGFAAIADPIRPEVYDAIQACNQAGVRVKIVTGDNVETAREIARQIGLITDQDDDSALVVGHEFEKMDDAQASEAVQRLKVLARARPLDKMHLVRTLQDGGEVVAVTGDGTNDAPALNYANVGLAMGKTGTAVAKEASDIILLDDSFGSIVKAIMWGRSLYENIQRFILFQLTINVAALTIALVGPFIGVELPFTVTQMLWVNLIMDTFAALALATEPPHWSVMNRPPRHPKAFIVTPSMAKNIFGVGIVFVVILVGFLFYLKRDGLTPYELSYFFAFFVMLQFWNLFNARMLGQNTSALAGVFENKSFLSIAIAIFIGQILLTQFGGEIFRTVPLSLQDWLVIIGSTSLVLWVGEIIRLILRSREGAPAHAQPAH